MMSKSLVECSGYDDGDVNCLTNQWSDNLAMAEVDHT